MKEPPAPIRIYAREYLTEETIEDVGGREVLDDMQAQLFHIGMKRLSIQAGSDRLSEIANPMAQWILQSPSPRATGLREED